MAIDKTRIKLCVVTGTRAEYGLLSPLLRLARRDAAFAVQLVVTGMHLAPKFGLTVKEIEKDGFKIDAKVDMELSGDSPSDTAKSAGLGLIGFGKVFAKLKPDVIVVLGDRFEILSAVEAALFARIPVAHISGGERTDGAYDDSIRHAITKMSHLHFTAAGEYSRRVIQLGEDPKRVFNVGAMAVDSIAEAKLMTRTQFEKSIGKKLNTRNLLVTFHPATADGSDSTAQFKHLLKAIDKLKDTLSIFTMPNADTGGGDLFKLVEDYVARNPERALCFVSLGRIRYLSAMKYVNAVVGNSSSGIVEAPSFKIGTVNIGSRQAGRIRAASIIDCEATEKAISSAFKKLYSKPFQAKLEKIESPFGKPGASARILKAIKAAKLKGLTFKSFHDL